MSPKDARPRKGAADQVAPEYDADRPDPPHAGTGGVRERRRAPWWVKMLAFFTGLLLLFFAVTRLDLVPGLDDVRLDHLLSKEHFLTAGPRAWWSRGQFISECL
ncbi:hypothetical protein ACWGUL_19660, partial [Streptomyces albidoflavus]